MVELLDGDSSSASGTSGAPSTDARSVLMQLLGALPNSAQVDKRA